MGREMREERPFPSSRSRPQGDFYFSIIQLVFWGDTQQKPLRRRVLQKAEAIWCSQNLYSLREYFIQYLLNKASLQYMSVGVNFEE